MPSVFRKESPLNIYHVCDRGVDRRIIFNDDDDRKRFVELLQKNFKLASRKLLAWCLMDNHIHLVVQMDKQEMSDTMQSLIGSYASSYNGRHNRSGYLFQGRFRSQPIDTERYLLSAIRYVHQNPLKAHMVPSCTYPWSSYSEYLDGSGITDTEMVLGTLGGQEGFLSLHEQQEDDIDVSFIDVDNGWKMSESESWEVARRVLGESVTRLGSMTGEERANCIRRLLLANLTSSRIAKIAQVSPALVSKIKNG